jgi:sugar-specific transcriptional regulator TrmB
MSKDWMLKTLVGLGLRELDAEVYVFLATNGPQEAKNIATALKLYRQQLYGSLKNLRKKGIVNASPERPARFSAVLFERVLELFLEAKMEQQRTLQESREELLSTWKSVIKEDFSDS